MPLLRPFLLFVISSIKTLSLSRYNRVYLFVYTGNNVYPSNLPYIIDYCKPAAIQICNEQLFPVKKFHRQKSFGDLLLDSPFTSLRHVHDVYKSSSSFGNLTFFLLQKLNVYCSISARQNIFEVPGHVSIKDSLLNFFAVSRCRHIFCLISTIFISRTLQRLSHAVDSGVVSAYEHLSPNGQIFLIYTHDAQYPTYSYTARLLLFE